ncbi:hypothetical protein JCM39068_35540 [Desulfocastanea catecholica]
MILNIRKVAIKRLFIIWILLSLVIGGIDFYMEMKDADNFFMNLALKESELFTKENLHLLDQSNVNLILLQQKTREFLKGHFVNITLYNRDMRKIIKEITVGADIVDNWEKKHPQPFLLAESRSFRKVLIGDSVFIQILLPLREKNGTIAGYFEGVYRVDLERVQQLRSGMVRNLLLIVTVALITSIVFYPLTIFLHRELVRFAANLLKGNLELMAVLGTAIAQRDSDTGLHNYRVTIYAIRLAESINLDSVQIRSLIAGAFLHDVGKIGISDNILLKPGKLTEAEFSVMRAHVLLGVDIISKSPSINEMAREVVEFHHEKFDGSGYMRGLRGKEIPLNARIFTIADVFDALTSKRPYKEPFSVDTAMRIVHEGTGSFFDPELVRAFSTIVDDMYAQVSSLAEAEVERMLETAASAHFFNDSYLAQFMKKQIRHSWVAAMEEWHDEYSGTSCLPDSLRRL